MSGLKKNQPALRKENLTEFAISPDEIDRYEVYNVIFPIATQTYVGTVAVGGTAAVQALVVDNRLLDYPRSLEVVHLGTHGDMDGTMVVNGVNQFGDSITESFAITTAANGGTQPGTAVFAQVESGTFTFGTAVGNGTVSLGVGTAGTTTLFGLPFKLGGTTDVKSITYTAEMVPTAINGGTIAAFVDTDQHAFKAAVDVVGTSTYQVWAKPTYNAEYDGEVAGLDQAV